MTIAEKTKELLKLRQTIAEEEKVYKERVEPLKAQRDGLTQDILAHLKKTKQLSIRYDFAIVTRSSRKTPKIVDEARVVTFITEKGLANEYLAFRPNDVFLENLPKIIKDNPIEGVEISETEFISIKNNKQE